MCMVYVYFTIYLSRYYIVFLIYLYNRHCLRAAVGSHRVGVQVCWPLLTKRPFTYVRHMCYALTRGPFITFFFLYRRLSSPIFPPPRAVVAILLWAKSIKSQGRGCLFFFFFPPFLLCRGVALGKPHDCEKPEVNIIYIYINVYARDKKKKCLKKIPTLLHDKRIKKAANHDRWWGKKFIFFFALAKSGIVLYFLIFSDLKYRVRRPSCHRDGLFLKAFL